MFFEKKLINNYKDGRIKIANGKSKILVALILIKIDFWLF